MTSPLTYSQLQSLWSNTASGTSYDTPAWSALMASIALAESGGSASATNPTDNNGAQTSYGLWQISNGTHNAPVSNWNDPAVNAQLALAKLQAQGLSAWGTFTSGTYASYLPSGASVPPGTPSPGGAAGTPGSAPGATAAGIDLNPVTWVAAPVKGLEWAGNWLTGGVLGNVTTDVQGLAGITQGLVGITQTLSKIGQLFLIIMRPAFWLRVGAFFAGTVALVIGLKLMGDSLR